MQGERSSLDFRLAWRRVRGDLGGAFVRFPFELEVIEQHLEEWLSEVRTRATNPEYSPRYPVHFDVPKPRWMVRPGTYIELDDRVIFTAAVGACASKIREAISWSQGTRDFDYMPCSTYDSGPWFERFRTCWDRFRTRSLDLIETKKYPAILSTDLVGFYENISIETLSTDLAQIGVSEDIRNLIRTCLRIWSPSQSSDRGLPQSWGASHLLSKLYFNSIDKALAQRGYTHHRYVDDLLLFCSSNDEARKVILDLSALLRSRGLVMHAEKSKILGIAQARARFTDAQEKINSILEPAVASNAEAAALADPYLDLEEMEELMARIRGRVSREAYETALRTYFVESEGLGTPFDKTLFHFVLYGLAATHSDYGVSYCLSSLSTHPEETEYVLHYFTLIGVGATLDVPLAKYLASPVAIYSHQKFRIVEWALNRTAFVSEPLMAAVRALAWDATQPVFLRATCKAILGMAADTADLDRIWQEYGNLGSDLERAASAISLRKLERARRNQFYANIEGHSTTLRSAVRVAKAMQDS